MPWLCTLLTRDTYSPECQKAAVQSLQLLGLCDGAPLEQMRTYLGPATLEVLMEAQDATQAAMALTGDALATLHPQIDAFLAVHRRNLRPENLHIADSVAALLDDEADALADEPLDVPSVSYTHLTLPTICSV